MTLLFLITEFTKVDLEKNIESEVRLAWIMGTIRWKKKCLEIKR
jgi:hypothetical protein